MSPGEGAAGIRPCNVMISGDPKAKVFMDFTSPFATPEVKVIFPKSKVPAANDPTSVARITPVVDVPEATVPVVVGTVAPQLASPKLKGHPAWIRFRGNCWFRSSR